MIDEGKAGDWTPNGEGSVSIANYAAQKMDVDVSAHGDVLVATSIPAWKGWSAEVDGRPIESVGYNHAFLAFRVPAGRHRLSLRYLPAGFGYGVAISFASALLLCVWRLAAGADGSDYPAARPRATP